MTDRNILLVCGGRDFEDAEALDLTLNALWEWGPWDGLVQGGAKGADALAADWARRNGIKVATFRADWAKHGKRAGILRNQEMLKVARPSLVVAFPGGRGTLDMVTRAKAAGVPVSEVAIRKTN